MERPRLDIAIATFGKEGIRRVCNVLLAPRPDVRYIISWQSHQGIALPDGLDRKDVEVHRLDQPGVSRNRNNALSHCKGDYVLFADDDIEFLSDSFDKVTEAFANNPDSDILLFKAEYPFRKSYPEDSCDICLPFPKGYSVGTIEIACRRQTAGRLRFSLSLGPGAPFLTAGEDEYFVICALRQGCRCRFVNTLICRHPRFSTGMGRPFDDGILRSSGFIIATLYPLSAILRLPLKAWRISRPAQLHSAPSFLHALRCLCQGASHRIPV